MAEINGTSDAVAAYLMREGKEVNQTSIEACRDELYELANDIWGTTDTSIFTLDEKMQMTEEEFSNYLSQSATGGDVDEEQVKLLFSILNFDGGDTLSFDELSLIADKRKDGIVTNFGIWKNIIGDIEPDAVISSLNNLKNYANSIKDVFGEDSDEYKTAESGNEVQATKQTLDTDKIEIIAQKIMDGNAKLQDYKDLLTESSYNALSEAYNALINADEENSSTNVSETTAQTNSTIETTENTTTTVQENSTISTTNTIEETATTQTSETSNQTISEEVTIEEQDVSTEIVTANIATVYIKVDPKLIAEDLYNAMKGAGTDEDTLEDILINMSISPEQFVEVVEEYENAYGLNATPAGVGLVTRIEQDTSGELQTNLTTALGAKLINAAKDGNENALDMICLNLYSGTAGQNGTADDFLAAVFDGAVDTDTGEADYELIYKINERYSNVIEEATGSKRNLIEDIQNDHGGILNWRNWFGHWDDSNLDASSKGQKYIDLINKAIRRHIE